MKSMLTSSEAILERLELASDEGWPAQLRVSDGTEFDGTVLLSEDQEVLVVFTTKRVTHLHPGAPLHASVTGPSGDLSFYSAVVRVIPRGELHLELPQIVRVVDNRVRGRRALGDSVNVCVVVPLGEAVAVFKVVDLSAGGFSFRVPRQFFQVDPNERLKLRLKIPGCRSVRLRVIVRNLRRDPQAAGYRLIGVEVEMGPDDLVGHVTEALDRSGRAA